MDIITLWPSQNGHQFSGEIFSCIFFNESVYILIKFSWTFVPRGPINSILASVQKMARHRPGNKPLSGPMMFNLLMHICVIQPQWVKHWLQ